MYFILTLLTTANCREHAIVISIMMAEVAGIAYSNGTTSVMNTLITMFISICVVSFIIVKIGQPLAPQPQIQTMTMEITPLPPLPAPAPLPPPPPPVVIVSIPGQVNTSDEDYEGDNDDDEGYELRDKFFNS